MNRRKEFIILAIGCIGVSVVCIIALFGRAIVHKEEMSDNTENLLVVESSISESVVVDTETLPSQESESIEEMIELSINIQDHYITNTGDPSNLYYIDEKGTLWGCGRNDYGQLGQGTQDLDFHEEMVRIAEHVIHVDYSQNGFTIFLTEDHKLYGMGTAATGVLREMNEITYEMFINRDQYVVTNPKLLLENVIYARCGNGDVACIMEDGSVWNWGTIWQEGMSSYCLIEPQKVLEEAVLVTGGWYNHAALLKDGSVWTWGYNYAGNCGVAGEIVISNPVKVAEDVIMVWTGNTHYNVGCYDISEFDGVYERYLENTIILKADSTYWACGIGLGGKTKILDRYWEASYYEVECTNEFVQVKNENSSIEEIYTTKVIESLSEKICYEEEDIITYDQSGYISSIDVRNPDTAERLFQCIRNSQYIHDLTGANLEPKHLPICINGEAMGDFGNFYSYIEGDMFIEFIFTEEDSKAFYEYFME